MVAAKVVWSLDHERDRKTQKAKLGSSYKEVSVTRQLAYQASLKMHVPRAAPVPSQLILTDLTSKRRRDGLCGTQNTVQRGAAYHEVEGYGRHG